MFTQYSKSYIQGIILILLLTFLYFVMSAHAQGTDQRVNSLAWSNDGAKLAIGFADGTLQIIDALNYQILNSFQLPQEGFKAIYEVAWNPVDASVLSVAMGDSGNRQAEVWVLDITTV